MARPDPVALDAERHVRSQPDRQIGSGGVRGMPVVSDQRPVGGHPAVVEVWLADELHLDVALEADDRAHQHVVGVVIGGRPSVGRDGVVTLARPHRQRVAHQRPAGRGLPGRGDDVRPGLVDARRRHVDSEGPEPERARLAIEQRSEHARRVEARDAEPVDRAVRSQKRARMAVREERVVGDRREGRGGRRALGAVAAAGSSLMSPPTARASRRARQRDRPPPPGPTIPSRIRGPPGASRAAAASPATPPRRCPAA